MIRSEFKRIFSPVYFLESIGIMLAVIMLGAGSLILAKKQDFVV